MKFSISGFIASVTFFALLIVAINYGTIWLTTPAGTVGAHVRFMGPNPREQSYLACRWNPDSSLMECMDLDKFMRQLSGSGPELGSSEGISL